MAAVLGVSPEALLSFFYWEVSVAAQPPLYFYHLAAMATWPQSYQNDDRVSDRLCVEKRRTYSINI